MEFRYRAGDWRPLPEGESSRRAPSSTAYFPDPAFRDVQPSVYVMTDEMLNRELDKARIWQEVLMEEIVRRRVLMKAELRRQMIGESSDLTGFVWMGVGEAREGFGTPGRFVNPPLNPLPEVRPPSTLAAEPNKAEKLILPGLPDRIRNLPRESKKPDLGGVNDKKSENKERPLVELSCTLCQVSASSQKQLIEHLAGKRHQDKSRGSLPLAGRKRDGSPMQTNDGKRGKFSNK